MCLRVSFATMCKSLSISACSFGRPAVALNFLHSEHSNDVARLQIAEDLVDYKRSKGGAIGESPRMKRRD